MVDCDLRLVRTRLHRLDEVRPTRYVPSGPRIAPRSAGAHVTIPHDDPRPTLTAWMLVGAGLAAVGIILGVAWFLTAFPVPS